MKLIVAIVQPFKVPELVDAIEDRGRFPGMTVLDCRGFGRGISTAHLPGAGVDVSDFARRMMILVMAPDAETPGIADWIAKVAHTGRPGDGKVFVVPIEAAIRIASGERDEEAL